MLTEGATSRVASLLVHANLNRYPIVPYPTVPYLTNLPTFLPSMVPGQHAALCLAVCTFLSRVVDDCFVLPRDVEVHMRAHLHGNAMHAALTQVHELDLTTSQTILP